MKRKLTHRRISVVLVFALLCCVMANPALATLLEDRAATATSASFAVPELLGVADASAYTARLTEKETDLNIVVLKKANGAETLFYSARPVKYVDDTGKVRDISTALTRNTGGALAAMLDNAVKAYFPYKSTGGMLLDTGDTQIVFIPVGANVSGAVAERADVYGDVRTVVEYAGVFGSGTTVHYTPEAFGFKEDIILESYPGTNEFAFRIITRGLRLETDGRMCFFINADNETVAHIGEIIVFDDNRFTLSATRQDEDEEGYVHTYAVEEVSANKEYLLTMRIDNRWLTDPDTTYPVIIDPSVTMTVDSGISDCTVINYPENLPNYGSSTSLFVGEYCERYQDNDWEEARTWIKYANSAVSSIPSASSITSAKLLIRDIMCEATSLTVSAYQATASWSESSLTYNYSTWSGYSGFLDSNTVSYNNGASTADAAFNGTTGTGNWYAFDITSAARAWKSGTANNGIVLINSTGLPCRTFASSERGSYCPVFKFDYVGEDDEPQVPQPTSIWIGGNSPTEFTPFSSGNTYVFATHMESVTTKQVPVTVYPETAPQNVSWSSNNNNVAYVSNGMLYANAVGTANITCTSLANPSVSTTLTVRVFNEFGGRAYSEAPGNTINCLEFAINQPRIEDEYNLTIMNMINALYSPPSLSQWNEILDTFDVLLQYTAAVNDFSIEPIQNQFSPISDGEYRIALRLFWKSRSNSDPSNGQMNAGDYHLIWQDSAGNWCEKRGGAVSTVMGFCDVTDLDESWDGYVGYSASPIRYYKCDHLVYVE